MAYLTGYWKLDYFAIVRLLFASISTDTNLAGNWLAWENRCWKMPWKGQYLFILLQRYIFITHLARNVGERVARMLPDYGDARHFLWWLVTLAMSHHIHSYLFIYRVSVLWHSFCHSVNMWQSHVTDMSPSCLVSRHLVSAKMLSATFRVTDILS